MLIVAYTLSYIDRTILTLLVKPIRETLQISDVQISLLHGLAFALFYTFMGIPIGRLADRYNRVQIITSGIALWSLMTALCGLARNFGQMFLARMGVGVGEAALSPAAYSMLADYFKGPQYTLALSIYTSAIYTGAGLALVLGGAIISSVPAMNLPFVGHLEPWQVVFMFVGLPGLVVALWVMTLREPARLGVESDGKGDNVPSFGEVVRHVRSQPAAFGLLLAGYASLSLLWNGAMAWIPTYFMRVHGWTVAEVGLRFGLVLGLLGTIGIICGGLISGELRRRGRTDSNLLVGIMASLLILPAGLLAPGFASADAALAGFGLFVFAGAIPWGAAPAAFTEISPNRMRAQVSAMYLFGINLAGIGLGPTVVAYFTQNVFGYDASVGSSLATVTALTAPLAALLLWLGLKSYRASMAKNFC